MVSKSTEEAKRAMNASIKVLEQALELAVEKQELDIMIAISDRLMMIYQHLSDKNNKKFKTGFSIIDPIARKPNNEEEDNESDGH